MDNSFPVDRSKPAGYLFHDGNGLRDLKLASLSQDGMKALALDVFHRDEFDFLGFAEIEDADDVPVADLARQDQFLFEALQNLTIAGQLRPNDFERDLPLQLQV